jgi:hypothetical protein
MKLLESHAAWKDLGERGCGVCGGVGVDGYCSVYEVWLSMCCGSFFCRSMVICAGFPVMLVSTVRRVSSMC